jgi:hypothetical protein
MSTWPAGGIIIGTWQASAPEVERVSMESGPGKQTNSEGTATISMPVTYHFEAAAWAAWKAWYLSDINRSGWFTWTEPDEGTTVRARIKGGLVKWGPTTTTKACYRASMTIEYLR